MTPGEQAEIVEQAFAGFQCVNCRRFRRPHHLVPSILVPGEWVCDGQSYHEYVACRDLGYVLRIYDRRG